MTPIFRILYRLYRIVSWMRYTAQRRFTSAGWTVLGAMTIAALIGPDTENNVAYQALTLLFALLVLGVIFSWFFRARFSADRTLPRFGTAGQPFRYRVSVRNLTRKPQSGLTLLENLSDPRPEFAEWMAVQVAEGRRARPFRVSQRLRTNPFKRASAPPAPVPPLLPHQEGEVRVELTPLRRGVLRFSGVTLARPDPLGLIRAFNKVPLPQTALILPKRYVLPPFALPGSMKYQQGGVALASNVGQSDEFVALRDYRRGDPLRHIHWRSWARTGRPIVKEFEDEFFVRHALVLDTFTREPHSEVFEEAVSVAASFACTLVTQESLLDLLFVGTQAFCFTGGRGLAHADQMLEILASVRPCEAQPFSSLEGLVCEHASLVSGCICVFLSWNEQRRGFVEKLEALNVPVLVLVVAESGGAKALTEALRRDGPGRFHVLEVGQIEQGLAKLK
jgi:uncharacterized protein (DUF58 family)